MIAPPLRSAIPEKPQLPDSPPGPVHAAPVAERVRQNRRRPSSAISPATAANGAPGPRRSRTGPRPASPAISAPNAANRVPRIIRSATLRAPGNRRAVRFPTILENVMPATTRPDSQADSGLAGQACDIGLQSIEAPHSEDPGEKGQQEQEPQPPGCEAVFHAVDGSLPNSLYRSDSTSVGLPGVLRHGESGQSKHEQKKHGSADIGYPVIQTRQQTSADCPGQHHHLPKRSRPRQTGRPRRFPLRQRPIRPPPRLPPHRKRSVKPSPRTTEAATIAEVLHPRFLPPDNPGYDKQHQGTPLQRYPPPPESATASGRDFKKCRREGVGGIGQKHLSQGQSDIQKKKSIHAPDERSPPVYGPHSTNSTFAVFFEES